VGQTEVVVDKQAAGFRAQVISLKDLCLDDIHRKILIKCLDNNVHASWGAAVTIGQFTTTVYDMLHDMNKCKTCLNMSIMHRITLMSFVFEIHDNSLSISGS
jgi:hypothetical protein